RDQRTASTYIFGAVCPKEGKGAALIMPACNTEAMNLHLAEIAATVAPAAHAILLVDQAGWHLSTRLLVPANITIILLPPKCPELNSRTSGSSCATTGSPTASSNPTTISSTIVVRHGTSSSISLGASCPSDCANGPTGSDQWDLVLRRPSDNRDSLRRLRPWQRPDRDLGPGTADPRSRAGGRCRPTLLLGRPQRGVRTSNPRAHLDPS